MEGWRKELVDKVTWTVHDWSKAARGEGRPLPPGSMLGTVLAIPSHTKEAQEIRKALTLKPSKLPPHLARRVKPTRFYSEGGGALLAPALAWVAMGFQRPVKSLRFRPTEETRTVLRRYVNKHKLFPYQRAAVKALLECAYAVGGAICCCPCGMGKSVCSSIVFWG